jgi:hypothetical protein
MTREEMFEFLEIPANSSETDIIERIEDKLTYFQRLSENAPNDFLRKLHTENVKKIQVLQSQLLSRADESSHQHSTNYVSANSDLTGDYGDTSANLRSAQNNKTAVAWLVRHTENQSAKPFPLYYGKNFIGRNSHPSDPTIIINEDPYVSRIHCCLEVESIKPLQMIISDGGALNNKPSKNGTYVNGNEQRLTKKVSVSENDTLQVGMTKFAIRLNNDNIKKIVQEVDESDYMKTVIIDIF